MLNRTGNSPKMRDYARMLLNFEANAPGADESDIPPAARVFDTLRRSLSTLIGVNGYMIILARALTLAKSDVPGLAGLQVNAEGDLEGPGRENVLVEDRGDNRAEPFAALIARLFTLLSAFIGENLLFQILHGVWPDVALSNDTTSGESEHDATR